MVVREQQRCACRTNGILLCLHLFFFLSFIYLFFDCAESSLLCKGFLCLRGVGSTLLCVGFLLRWLLVLQSVGSRGMRASVVVLHKLSCS